MIKTKYVIINGYGIIFSGCITHKEMVGYGQTAQGAGFVSFITELDEYGDTIVKVRAYGASDSLGVASREEDSAILTRQITNRY